MNRYGTFTLGIITGAGLMYLLDPDRGARRRALIRDQFVHGMHEVEDIGSGLASRTRHARNRAVGTLHEVRAQFVNGQVDDPVLEARVRAVLGRVVHRPGAVEVSADHGRVVLGGTALPEEIERVAAVLSRVPGVRQVVNRLDARAQPGTTDTSGAVHHE